VYPGTPGIIVSNLSVTLHPNRKDLTRFEIAASQVYTHAADTQSGNMHGTSDF
jgi:hypothetical protein